MKMSAPTLEAKAQLKQGIETDIDDAELRGIVMARLGKILSDEPLNWDDAQSWQDYVRSAKAPTAQELAAFHAKLACEDAGGAIAAAMAVRAKDFEAAHFGRGYAKLLADALLDESCKGGQALTPATRAALTSLASAPE
jgi:hypothetical protein